MNETQIVNTALARLHTQTGIEGKWFPQANEMDGKIDFYLNANDMHFFVEVKKELREHQLPKLQEMANRYHPFMVVAQRIFPAMKEILRERKIGYLAIFMSMQKGILYGWMAIGQ
jgi:hypothetical protein